MPARASTPPPMKKPRQSSRSNHTSAHASPVSSPSSQLRRLSSSMRSPSSRTRVVTQPPRPPPIVTVTPYVAQLEMELAREAAIIRDMIITNKQIDAQHKKYQVESSYRAMYH